MVVNLLVHKNVQNDSIKGKLKGALYVALKSTPKISLWEHFRLQLIIHLTVQSRGAPEGSLEGAPKDALHNFHKHAQEDAPKILL